MKNDIIQEFFQEIDKYIATPALTMQEIPYKEMERIFARFGAYEKFKEYIQYNYWDQEYVENRLNELQDKIDDQDELINSYENAIRDTITKLQQEFPPTAKAEELIRDLKRAIF